ncbi:MAG TPA: ABC transporter permease [Gemmatimonadaceae bacterium]|jgi:putative ABC transport system permease protein
MDNLVNDLRFAVRSLLRAPAFTIAAVVALGLGTGATAAVFSMLNGVVLRPLPYAHPDRLVTLWEINHAKGLEHEPISPVNFVDYRGLTATFSDAAAWWRPELNLTDDATANAIRVTGVEATRNFADVLGVRPMLGHGFTPEEGLYGKATEALISYRLWQARFAADAKVVGRGIRLNGFLYTIVGVMPPGFNFPGETDLWQGMVWNPSQHSRGAHFMEGVARLAPRVTIAAANRELGALTVRLGDENRATNANWSARAVALDREVAGVFRPALFALFGAAGVLLAIACLNVANLLLARATTRRREVALRAAIGASRPRLVRLFLTESLLLALLGGALGVVVALISVKGLLAWSPIQIPRASEIGVDTPVLLFATVIAALTAVAFGLAPALALSRAELHRALQEGSRGSSAGGRRTRGALVVSEVALAVILLSGAGLLVRSVSRLLRADLGVDATSVLTADVQLPDVAYKDWSRVDLFYTNLMAALRARPEVVSAGATNFLPLESGWRMPFRVRDQALPRAGDEPTAQYHTVDEGYFGALRVPVVAGRTFQPGDDASAPGVVVVNETLARQYWPGTSPIGKRVVTHSRTIGPLGSRIVAGDEHEVIGVVRDVKNVALRNPTEPAFYFSERQFPFRKMHLVVRARGDAGSLAPVIRAAVRGVDPTLPVANVMPLGRALAASADPPRFVMLLLGVFATLALTLAGVGIYGILTYAVTQRRKEIGIRVALGAQPSAMLRMIVREGLVLAVIGCAIGALGAMIAGRSLASFLYEVAPADPMTLAAVAVVVLLVATGACLIPGRRAAGEDPVRALRTSE